MKYIDFVTNEKILSMIQGSSMENLDQLEGVLGFTIPLAMHEYLELMGEKTVFPDYDHHGTKEILYMHEWMYDWIHQYREEGLSLDQIEQVLPFFKWIDTFFYIPINGADDPPIYAFDINVTPTIRKLNDSFTEFIRWNYFEAIKKIGG